MRPACENADPRWGGRQPLSGLSVSAFLGFGGEQELQLSPCPAGQRAPSCPARCHSLRCSCRSPGCSSASAHPASSCAGPRDAHLARADAGGAVSAARRAFGPDGLPGSPGVAIFARGRRRPLILAATPPNRGLLAAPRPRGRPRPPRPHRAAPERPGLTGPRAPLPRRPLEAAGPGARPAPGPARPPREAPARGRFAGVRAPRRGSRGRSPFQKRPLLLRARRGRLGSLSSPGRFWAECVRLVNAKNELCSGTSVHWP